MRACFISVFIVLGFSLPAQSTQEPETGLPAAAPRVEDRVGGRRPPGALFHVDRSRARRHGLRRLRPDGYAWPPTLPIDRVLAIKDGKARVFAENLWCVKGLEWVDGNLFVVHAPFLPPFETTTATAERTARRLDHRPGPAAAGF